MTLSIGSGSLTLEAGGKLTRAGFEIRALGAGEAEELARLLAESFAEELTLSGLSAGNLGSQIQTAARASHPPLAQLLRLAGIVVELWVAAQDGRPIGCYALFGRTRLTISTVAVRPEHRSQGVGRRLMEHALERVRQLERQEVLLDVLAENEAAVQLYRSLGMQEYDRRRTYTIRLSAAETASGPGAEPQCAPISPASLDRWGEVLRASVPPEALRFADIYRSDYISNRLARWAGERVGPSRIVRRAVLQEGGVIGFAAVRYSHRQPMAEVLMPLYLPEAAPLLPDLLHIATSEAARSERSRCRIYLSDYRPEAWDAAVDLGYEPERTWLYLYKEV